VRVLHRPARGIAPALCEGLAAARGRLIARMDADDETHPERLAAQAELLAARPELGLAGCQVESFREGGLRDGFRLYTQWLNGLVEPDDVLREAFVDCPLPHPTWLVPRATLERVGGWRDPDWPEDLDLFYRLLAAGVRAAKVPRVLYRWRDHDARLTRRDPRYGRLALARAKAHWLPVLRPMSAAILVGAGRTARRYARLLGAEGVTTRAFVAPGAPTSACLSQKIPLLGPAELALYASAWRGEGALLLGAAALRGARERIRGILSGHGLTEGRDFLMLA
jgi:hypothetical protein